MLIQPPISTLFPYTTLFRSDVSVRRLQKPNHVIRNFVVRKHLQELLLGFVTLELAVELSHRVHHLLRVLSEMSRLMEDRKSTRLNSSHLGISYAVFCLKKKN